MLAHQSYDDLRREIHRVTRGNRSEAAQSCLLIRRTMIYGVRCTVSHGEPFRRGPLLLAHQANDDLRREIHRVTRGNRSDAAQSCLLISRTMIYGGRYTE